MSQLTLSQQPHPLSPFERLAAAVCLSVAALMCGTACFNINTHLMDSTPVPGPAAPVAPPSAGTLAPGEWRAGVGGQGVGISPRVGEGTSTGQMGVNARLGVLAPGLELDAGFAVPVFQPYGMARIQVLGLEEKSPIKLSAEAGGAIGDGFAGFSVGAPLERYWDLVLDARAGSHYGRLYGEAGINFILHAASFMDMAAGAGIRYYGSEFQPDVTRGGVSVEFGPRPVPPEVRAALEHYQWDPGKLLAAGEFEGAVLAWKKQLKTRSAATNRAEFWELGSQILKAHDDLSDSRKAHRKAMRLGIKRSSQDSLEEIDRILDQGAASGVSPSGSPLNVPEHDPNP